MGVRPFSATNGVNFCGPLIFWAVEIVDFRNCGPSTFWVLGVLGLTFGLSELWTFNHLSLRNFGVLGLQLFELLEIGIFKIVVLELFGYSGPTAFWNSELVGLRIFGSSEN